MARTILLIVVLAAAAMLYAEVPPDDLPEPVLAKPVGAPATPAVPAAPSATPPPAAEKPAARSVIFNYVTDEADLAVLVRVGQLVRADVWKRFAAPDAGLYRQLVQQLPKPIEIDIQNQVSTAVLEAQLQWKDDQLDDVSVALILEMYRDVRPEDLLKERVESRASAELGATLYRVADDYELAVPQPRIVVIGRGPVFLRALQRRQNGQAKPGGQLPLDSLAWPGDVTFAAVVPPAFKKMLGDAYAKMHRSTLKADMSADRFIEFAISYNLFRVALEAESATGSVYLVRPDDALRADLKFASKQMAPFMVAILQAMADPIQIAIPALVGGAPLDEAPAATFYRAVADGPSVRLTMPRAAIERLVDQLVEARRGTAGRAESAENLRKLGVAITIYVTRQGKYPATWADLVRAELVREPALLENPALKDHLPTGDYELVPLTKAAVGQKAYARVLAYEVSPKDASAAGLNVLFADGHVEYVEAASFKALYKETLESLGR
jgi:prepilin-type processing-associated H-X9-DG protein